MSRSSRRLSQTSRAVAVAAYCLGAAALLVQITLPWLQALHFARERGLVTTTPVGITPYAHAGAIAANAASVSRPHWARHDGDACPVCQLIGQSRTGVILAAEGVAGFQLAQRVSPASPGVTLPIARRTAASPRAPPHSLT